MKVFWWAWMAEIRGEFMLYYPGPPENPMTVAHAFQTQFALETRYLTRFYRWVWDGRQWRFDDRSPPELLAQA